MSYSEGTKQTGYDSRSAQVVRALQKQQLRTEKKPDPLSRETSGLYLFLLQVCICLHLFAFVIY